MYLNSKPLGYDPHSQYPFCNYVLTEDWKRFDNFLWLTVKALRKCISTGHYMGGSLILVYYLKPIFVRSLALIFIYNLSYFIFFGFKL